MTHASTLTRPSSLPKVTYEEFIADETLSHHEWVDGEVFEKGVITEEHNGITAFLLGLLLSFVEAHEVGRIFYEPWNMKLRGSLPGRCPDLLVVLRANAGRIRKQFLDGPADVVVEVVSPSSAAVDRGAKFYEYEAGGVPEYWLIDPERQVAEFYHLDERGRYQLLPATDGVFRSVELPGFWLRVAWLWERPRVRDAEVELGLR